MGKRKESKGGWVDGVEMDKMEGSSLKVRMHEIRLGEGFKLTEKPLEYKHKKRTRKGKGSG